MRTNKKESIIYSIGTLYRIARRFADKALSSFGLKGVQGMVLIYIHSHDNVCQKDIEKHFMLSWATVSELMNSLEDLGFAERALSEDDKRQRRLLLTESGEKIVSMLIDKLDDLDSQLSASLGDNSRLFIDSSNTLISLLEDNLC